MPNRFHHGRLFCQPRGVILQFPFDFKLGIRGRAHNSVWLVGQGYHQIENSADTEQGLSERT